MNKLVAEHLPQLRMEHLRNKGFLSDEYWQEDYEHGSTDPMRMFAESSKDFRYRLKLFGHRQFVEVSWQYGDTRLFKQINFITTKPYFGNRRYWFKCPNCSKGCGVAYIFLDRVGCNTCLNVAYESQNTQKEEAIILEDSYEPSKMLIEMWYSLWEKNGFFIDNKPTRQYLMYLQLAKDYWQDDFIDPEDSLAYYQAHDPLLFKPPHIVIPR